MSKYTTEVRFICETMSGLADSVGYSSTSEIIEKAIPKIFDFDFPIFDENYRGVLERKILKHFYTREICEETAGLWKMRLDTTLNEIMPYYNQLYKSELYEFNPFYDVNITREHKGNGSESRDSVSNTDGGSTSTKSGSETGKETGNETVNRGASGNERTETSGSESSSGSTSGNKKQRYSDTPQGTISNLESDTYLTNATLIDESGSHNDSGNHTATQTVSKSNNENTTGNKSVNTEGTYKGTEGNTHNSKTTGTVGITNTESYIETVKGKQGQQNYSDLLIKFRKTFLNIDMQVIHELDDLFINLW